MKEIKGDIIKLFNEGYFDVIIQGCNCMCVMGSGLAKQIKINFPEAYNVDKKTVKGDKSKLGNISVAIIGSDKYIVNAYTQYDYGRDKVQVDYDAVASCMRKVKLEFTGKRIGLPKIGAGLAGGDWDKIKGIIESELKGEDVTIVIF